MKERVCQFGRASQTASAFPQSRRKRPACIRSHETDAQRRARTPCRADRMSVELGAHRSRQRKSAAALLISAAMATANYLTDADSDETLIVSIKSATDFLQAERDGDIFVLTGLAQAQRFARGLLRDARVVGEGLA